MCVYIWERIWERMRVWKCLCLYLYMSMVCVCAVVFAAVYSQLKYHSNVSSYFILFYFVVFCCNLSYFCDNFSLSLHWCVRSRKNFTFFFPFFTHSTTICSRLPFLMFLINYSVFGFVFVTQITQSISLFYFILLEAANWRIHHTTFYSAFFCYSCKIYSCPIVYSRL